METSSRSAATVTRRFSTRRRTRIPAAAPGPPARSSLAATSLTTRRASSCPTASSSSPRTYRLTPAPTHVFDYNYTSNTITDITPSVANGDPANLVSQLAAYPSYTDRFLMLPNGQALFTVGADSQLYVYTGTGPVDTSSTPSISGIFSNGGNSYTLTGSALNGASQGATYGDDAEMDTNYPIVSVATDIGTTYYADTTNWNMTGVGATERGHLGQLRVAFRDQLAAERHGRRAGRDRRATAQQRDGRNVHRPQRHARGQYAATIDWGDGTPKRPAPSPARTVPASTRSRVATPIPRKVPRPSR